MIDAIVQLGSQPASTCRNVCSTSMPCGEWTTSGCHWTPQMRRPSCSIAATGASGVEAVQTKPSGGMVTASKWLIHTSCSTGDPASSWCRTGDMATRDADGYLWYQGRADDVFKSAGYRIGPSEIENCLVKHAAVANAAVVPKPDRQRGALVKAYVVLAAGHAPGDALVAELDRKSVV